MSITYLVLENLPQKRMTFLSKKIKDNFIWNFVRPKTSDKLTVIIDLTCLLYIYSIWFTQQGLHFSHIFYNKLFCLESSLYPSNIKKNKANEEGECTTNFDKIYQ